MKTEILNLNQFTKFSKTVNSKPIELSKSSYSMIYLPIRVKNIKSLNIRNILNYLSLQLQLKKSKYYLLNRSNYNL